MGNIRNYFELLRKKHVLLREKDELQEELNNLGETVLLSLIFGTDLIYTFKLGEKWWSTVQHDGSEDALLVLHDDYGLTLEGLSIPFIFASYKHMYDYTIHAHNNQGYRKNKHSVARLKKEAKDVFQDLKISELLEGCVRFTDNARKRVYLREKTFYPCFHEHLYDSHSRFQLAIDILESAKKEKVESFLI